LSEALGSEVEHLAGAGPTPESLTVPPAAFPLDPAAWLRVLAAARELVGRPSQLAPHPCGFVPTGCPAEDCVPLQRAPGGVGLTQLDQAGVAAVGLIKLDLLSNRALSALAEAQELVRALSPPEVVSPSPASSEAEDGDPATLALLARGDTLGVSHLETPGMRLLLRRLRPRSLAVPLSLAPDRELYTPVPGDLHRTTTREATP
jgi:DNA polymerase III alpha subunit